MKRISEIFEGMFDDNFDVAPLEVIVNKYKWWNVENAEETPDGGLFFICRNNEGVFYEFAEAAKELGYKKYKFYGKARLEESPVYNGLEFECFTNKFSDVKEFKNCTFTGISFAAIPAKGSSMKFTRCTINSQVCRFWGCDSGDFKSIKSNDTKSLFLFRIGDKIREKLESWKAVKTNAGRWEQFYRPRFEDLSNIDPIKELGLSNFKGLDHVELITVNSMEYPYVELTKTEPRPSYRDFSTMAFTKMANGWWIVTKREAFCR